MRAEIDDMINAQVEHSEVEEVHIDEEEVRRQKYEAMQNQLNMQFNKSAADHPVTGFI